MRNYWLKIALGALAVFAVGMTGITIVRSGLHRVHTVVAGSGPITIPLPFVPFVLAGDRLGTLEHLRLNRTAPKEIASVELAVKLSDSVVARGLEGCRLAANLATEHQGHDINIKAADSAKGAFWCLKDDSAATQFQAFGEAVFEPGDVSVPLFLPASLVAELRSGHFASDTSDEADAAAERADSIADAVEAHADSIQELAEQGRESIEVRTRVLIDSLRREGLRRADSARREGLRQADSARREVRRMADSLHAR